MASQTQSTTHRSTVPQIHDINETVETDEKTEINN